LLVVPGHHAPPQSPSITFRFLEREFKQRVPIVSYDYPPGGGGRPAQGFPIHERLRALSCLHFSVRSIGEYDAFMV
jgi:hypothetical protein